MEVRKAHLTEVVAIGMERMGWIWKFVELQGSVKARAERHNKDLCLGVKKRNVMGFIQISHEDGEDLLNVYI